LQLAPIASDAALVTYFGEVETPAGDHFDHVAFTETP
jgi:hypothetical protein